ncbi:MAG: histidine triad nucleotide-binding protein [Deltaproteobacteria bacterium RIFOXYA12_FULL_61_11]|nr:MAG: histidine triad nucleotide-binding protein [Deltaproteobacteria bacterium RIFOXYA12_FULL_61_11]
MPKCLFCSISSGEIPATIVYQDTDLLAFEDIAPQAPVHLLIIPRKHLPTLNELTSADHLLVGKMLSLAKDLAAKNGLAERGYRAVFNCNRDACQSVFHIHLHLLGGRTFGWPPG